MTATMQAALSLSGLLLFKAARGRGTGKCGVWVYCVLPLYKMDARGEKRNALWIWPLHLA